MCLLRVQTQTQKKSLVCSDFNIGLKSLCDAKALPRFKPYSYATVSTHNCINLYKMPVKIKVMPVRPLNF